MPHDHDDFATEPVRGLPEDLPHGRGKSCWQGQPAWWQLAKGGRSASGGWQAISPFLFALADHRGCRRTETWTESATAAVLFFLVLGGHSSAAILLLVALMQAKATVYTIKTNKRRGAAHRGPR